MSKKEIPINEVEKAFRTLFGEEMSFSLSVLQYIQPSGIKSAYREQVKLCHPDIIRGDDISEEDQNLKFQKVHDSYKILMKYKENRVLIRENGPVFNNFNFKTKPSVKPRPATGAQGPKANNGKNGTGTKENPAGPERKFEKAGFEKKKFDKSNSEKRTYSKAQTQGQERNRKKSADYYKKEFKKATKEKEAEDFFCNLTTPPACRLRFGEFLYYSKIISWKTLIHAIVYSQKRDDKKLGDYFLDHNILNTAEIDKYLKAQQTHNKKY